jgi:RNA polymerase sigma factor (sigma-70 family)
LTRLSVGGPLLRLRTDEQLVALFRAGSEEAFTMIVSRYQQRLFAYTRHMMGGSRQDAEDALQDVFVRAYGALRADEREVNVRAWLYRVAHNRCIDQLRRPTPPPSDVFEMSRRPLHDPVELAQRREDLRTLVEDVGRLPEQQRSALLMREVDGMSYADLAEALGTSVPAIKSLLVRARVGLAEAVEARDMDCSVIRIDLTKAYDRGVKATGRARRHMRECDGCREYRSTLRGLRRSFAALTPLGAGPVALLAQVLGLGGAGGGAAAGAGVGGGSAAVGIGAGGAAACKVAAVVCTAALATGGAVEVSTRSDQDGRSRSAATPGSERVAKPATAIAEPRVAAGAASSLAVPSARRQRAETLAKTDAAPAEKRRTVKRPAVTGTRPVVEDPSVPSAGLPLAAAPAAREEFPVGVEVISEHAPNVTGGAAAPAEVPNVVPPGAGVAPRPSEAQVGAAPPVAPPPATPTVPGAGVGTTDQSKGSVAQVHLPVER